MCEKEFTELYELVIGLAIKIKILQHQLDLLTDKFQIDEDELKCDG